MSLESLNTSFIKLQFGGKTRIRVYRKLVSFLKNGVPLQKALDILWNFASDDGAKPSSVQAVVIDAWRKQVANGMSFGAAISGWVPEKDRIVIEAGESAGRLDLAIENAIFIHTGGAQIRSALIGGLAYPVVLIAMAIGFMLVFGLQVVPAFAEVLPREQWTGQGAQMASMSDFVQNYLAPTLMGVLALIAVVVWSFPRWTGKVRVYADKIPPWSLYRLTMGSGFMLAVSGMVKAGIATPQILRLLQRNASPWYQERLSRTLQLVNNGYSFGDALHLNGFQFPDKETVKDLRAYSTMDGFDEILETLGREWMTDSVDLIKVQTGILKNLAFVFLGVIFAWIAGGIFSLQQQISAMV